MSGYSSSSYSEGTALGSNETLTADGIALGNAVKLRGYIDTVFSHLDNDDNTTVNETDISLQQIWIFLLISLQLQLRFI